MEFLKPYLQNKPQTCNLDSSEETDLNTDTDTNLSAASPSRPESQLSNHSDTTRKKSQPLSQMLFAQYQENKKKEEDPTDTFFLSMSKTVKQMPIQMQAQLKRQILLLVTDAEIKVASNASFQPETTNINPRQANTSSSSGYTTELRTESESLQLQSNSTNYNVNTYVCIQCSQIPAIIQHSYQPLILLLQIRQPVPTAQPLISSKIALLRAIV